MDYDNFYDIIKLEEYKKNLEKDGKNSKSDENTIQKVSEKESVKNEIIDNQDEIKAETKVKKDDFHEIEDGPSTQLGGSDKKQSKVRITPTNDTSSFKRVAIPNGIFKKLKEYFGHDYSNTTLLCAFLYNALNGYEGAKPEIEELAKGIDLRSVFSTVYSESKNNVKSFNYRLDTVDKNINNVLYLLSYLLLDYTNLLDQPDSVTTLDLLPKSVSNLFHKIKEDGTKRQNDERNAKYTGMAKNQKLKMNKNR